MKTRAEKMVELIEFWHSSMQKDAVVKRKVVHEIDIKGKEVVDLIGPRRSGKSTVLKLLIEKLKLTDNFLFINFEDPFFIENNSPLIIEELIETFKIHYNPNLKFLFFDEIQEIRFWEKALRKLRDSEQYKIFITGSSSKLLSKEISSALTGRHLTYHIYPLSFAEFLNFRQFKLEHKRDLILKKREIELLFNDYLAIGGFPEVVLSNKLELLKSYFFDLLQKDIINRYEVREKLVLEKMALFLLSNSAKTFSLRSLAKTFEVSQQLISTYLEYLKEAFIVFELLQFSYSLKTQQKALKKIYSIDTGFASQVAFNFSRDDGRRLENVVYLELKRSHQEIYYYKTAQNKEVDFFFKDAQGKKQLIQVCLSLEDPDTRKRELKSLTAAMAELKLKQSLILTLDEEGAIDFEKRHIEVKPVWKWTLEGAKSEKSEG